MQIPIINGIYTDNAGDFRTSYPRNLIPVPKQHGINDGYLRPADGIVFALDGPGKSRGAVNWDGVHYRVMGDRLISISVDNVITDIGAIPGTGHVTFDFSFTHLSISSDGGLHLYDKTTLRQVIDVDLGTVIDHIWVDGYFMSTDGEFLVVTELADPFSVLPTRYGSSEANPDPIVALVKLRNEPYALNRYTIEVFDNVGGAGFPFQRIDGAQIQRGAVGTHACCVFLESVAFVGGGRNEQIAVWLAASGNSVKISTREIDQLLSGYTEEVLSQIYVEERIDKGHRLLYIHLPEQTIVYDDATSRELEQPVWFTLSSGLTPSIYRARYFTRCYNKWWVGDPELGRVGYLTEATSEHWGELTAWEFSTTIIYNNGRGAIFHELELVCLPGRVTIDADPRIATQYSVDGMTWSMLKYVRTGKQGNRNQRLVWLQQGSMQHWRIQRFIGTSDAHLAVARLEARVEPLGV